MFGQNTDTSCLWCDLKICHHGIWTCLTNLVIVAVFCERCVSFTRRLGGTDGPIIRWDYRIDAKTLRVARANKRTWRTEPIILFASDFGLIHHLGLWFIWSFVFLNRYQSNSMTNADATCNHSNNFYFTGPAAIATMTNAVCKRRGSWCRQKAHRNGWTRSDKY